MGHCGCAVGRLAAERPVTTDHKHGAATGQHAMMHPAFGSFKIPYFSPIFEFRNDLDGHVLPNEDPVHRISYSRAGSDIDLFGLKRDVTGDWQAGHAANGLCTCDRSRASQ